MAVFGVFGIMIIVSQHYMWPVVMRANEMRERPIEERLKEIPWMFMDLLFPFLVEYLVRDTDSTLIPPLLMMNTHKRVGCLDDMVSHLGVDPESPRRAYTVCRSWILWRLVE